MVDMMEGAGSVLPSSPRPVPGLGLIWAEARGGAIGRYGVMPWHLPEDLAHFKKMTLGAPVLMGRRTWFSLPERFRPLPDRRNIVISRDPGLSVEGAETAVGLESALAMLESGAPGPAAPAWVMGGGELYRSALPYASTLAVTRIALDVQGADTFAPQIGPEWELLDEGQGLVSESGIEYRFERYRRAR